MINIELPERMREPFEGLSRAMLSVFPEGHVALGGGTVLEARWDHRVSTDLDFFIAAELLRDAYQRRGSRMYALLYDAIKAEGASINEGLLNTGPNSLFMSGDCADGTPWSIANMHYANPRQPMREAINGTGIRAATMTETLMGKIVGRAFVADRRQDSAKEPIPIRDCYDNGKEIVNPKWTMRLRGIASRIGDAVSARDVGLLPVAEPLDQSDEDTNDGAGIGMRSKPERDRNPSP